jgi:hypothetical protein
MEITWGLIASHADQFRTMGVDADTNVILLGCSASQSSLRDVARLALQSLGTKVLEVLPTSVLSGDVDQGTSADLTNFFTSSDYIIDCTDEKLSLNLDIEEIRLKETQIYVDGKTTWTEVNAA